MPEPHLSSAPPAGDPRAGDPRAGDPRPALEEVGCPLCGERAADGGGRAFPPFRVTACHRCDLLYLSPRLTEAAMLESYRDDSYFEGDEGPGYSSYLAQEETLRATFRRFLHQLERRGMTGGRLLEVGCAYGFFLDEARPYFEHRAGTDFSPAAASRARDAADRVYLGGLEALPADERYDAAALVHVIEHIYDPAGFLRRLTTHLAPGGWIVLAVPDAGSLWRPLLGRRWPFYKVPEHVTFFTRRSLARLLTAAGLEQVTPLPYVSLFSGALIAEKLGRAAPSWLADRHFRLPGTTVACAGRLPE